MLSESSSGGVSLVIVQPERCIISGRREARSRAHCRTSWMSALPGSASARNFRNMSCMERSCDGPANGAGSRGIPVSAFMPPASSTLRAALASSRVSRSTPRSSRRVSGVTSTMSPFLSRTMSVLNRLRESGGQLSASRRSSAQSRLASLRFRTCGSASSVSREISCTRSVTSLNRSSQWVLWSTTRPMWVEPNRGGVGSRYGRHCPVSPVGSGQAAPGGRTGRDLDLRLRQPHER